MANEYNGDKIVLRDTSGTQMSLPRFFQLALVSEDGSHTARPTSGLYRNDSSEFHGGWDIGTNGASDVPARTPTSGTAVYVGGAGGYGPNLVIIKEDNYERYHYFGHMASASVTQGSTVQQGDIVGIIGGYGGSSGNWNPSTYAIHLHYEIMTKNFKVSGGTSGDKEDVLDPMDVFDDATLPSGWLFGYDPQTKPTSYAAKANDWDYIKLDKDAVDFGPSGGEVAAEPYYPDKPCHDIAHPQTSSGSLNPCIDAIADAGEAGVIIQVGAIRSSGFVPENDFNPADAVQHAMDKGLGLGIYFYNYVSYETDATQIFQEALAYLQEIGATKEVVKLGVWLDTEYNEGLGYDPVPSSDPEVNYSYVERFLNVFNSGGYPVVGVYSSAANFENWYGSSRIGDKPIWAAWWPGLSFDEIDRSTLNKYLPESSYTNVYLWQYDNTGTVPGWSGYLDCVKVLSPMPVVGSGGGGGGGGGSYTEVIDVTVEVVPPKRIYFSPVPGLIETKDSQLDKRNQEITISTDADGADLYYTLDGSSPYQYKVVGETVAYELSSSAIHYEDAVKIFKDTHIRVIAVPAGTSGTFDEPLAKGSGTFLFKYQDLVHDWEAEKKAYATSDDNASFFEENRQAFLRLHATQTDEEILYAAVYKHDKEVTNEDAKDNATSSEGTQVISEEV